MAEGGFDDYEMENMDEKYPEYDKMNDEQLDNEYDDLSQERLDLLRSGDNDNDRLDNVKIRISYIDKLKSQIQAETSFTDNDSGTVTIKNPNNTQVINLPGVDFDNISSLNDNPLFLVKQYIRRTTNNDSFNFDNSVEDHQIKKQNIT